MGLPTHLRLKSAKRIAQLFELGHSVRKYPVRIIYVVQPSDESQLRYAVVAPKRIFKKAVTRNRVKRLLRESIRKRHLELHAECSDQKISMDMIVMYTSSEILELKRIDKAYSECCRGISYSEMENED